MTIMPSGTDWGTLNSETPTYSPFGIVTWISNTKRGAL